jgi:heptosyltransferase-2/heptosyltransferase-3
MLVRAGWDAAFIVDVKDHPLREGEHATEQWQRLAAVMPPALAIVPPARRPAVLGGCRLKVSTAQRAELEAWLQARELSGLPLILIQAGNKRTLRRGPRRLAVNHKYWPKERWAEVLRFLRQDSPRHAILMLGSGPEYALNRDIAATSGVARVYNVADDLPIPRLLALLARADGLISVDSGPAHAAAAVGCPLIVLFGKASPSLYRPWGASGAAVTVLTGEIDGEASMLGIDTASVTRAWAHLRRRDSRQRC